VACLAVLCVVLFFIFKPAIMGTAHSERPGDYLGADLGAPADAANPYSAARPEWYFLFLFQFLKFFPGDREIIGAIVIPSL
jgi:ubiquinol-cytochrome c reductase cytochrome b subunit